MLYVTIGGDPVSDQLPAPKATNQDRYTIFFMVVLSFACALILSILASALQAPQEEAREFDRSKQMLIAARIVNPDGYFQVRGAEGQYLPAELKNGRLIASDKKVSASAKDVLDVYRDRIQSFLVNNQGEETSFENAGIDEKDYINEYKKSGYYQQPLKLVYKIFANPAEEKNDKEKTVEGYVFPINGMGLWDAIYGFTAIRPDGNTVIGVSWYDQKETPGLGGNIAEAAWQSLFPDKRIFQPNPDGTTDFKTANVGITVIKGKVSEVYGDSPKGLTAVDGMAGATLTGNGINSAYKNIFSAYRPFLLKLQEKHEKKS